MRYRIGVDIGGTNTDGVLIDEKGAIIHAIKVPTTTPLEKGFAQLLQELLYVSQIPSTAIRAILVGTTHATNAILQNHDLYSVGVLRLAGHQPTTLPPGYSWPKELRKSILSGSRTVSGGVECDARPITKIDKEQIKEAAKELVDQGAESLAISAVFSPLHNEQELLALDILREVLGDIPISLSHRIGGLGFIERENATILNAALKKVIRSGFQNLLEVCSNLELQCPLFVTQNNGSLVSLEEALDYPILTLSAGPTNSFIGGAKLAGLKDALIVDIGGTSTDIGVVKNGFPRRCLHNCFIGGVSLNFSMPDVLSVALGGGSHVNFKEREITVGPQSVAKQLFHHALAFGGGQLTLTDVALSLNHIEIVGANKEAIHLRKTDAEQVMSLVGERIVALIQKMEVEEQQLPVVLVGGGASLIASSSLGERFQLPAHSSVANAYGAALAEIAVTINKVVCMNERDATLQALQDEAVEEVIRKGACANEVRIVEVSILPYFYMPGNLARVTVVAAGPWSC